MTIVAIPKPIVISVPRAEVPAITTNPKRMSGEPVIGLERMPVTTLLDHLIEGETIASFSDIFGTSQEQCRAALKRLRDAIDEGALTDAIATRVDY